MKARVKISHELDSTIKVEDVPEGSYFIVRRNGPSSAPPGSVFITPYYDNVTGLHRRAISLSDPTATWSNPHGWDVELLQPKTTITLTLKEG